MKLRLLLAGTVFAGLSLGLPAVAQSQTNGTPAFRVPLNSTSTIGTGSPIWAWMESVSQCSSTCGSGTRATSYVCQNVSDYDYSGTGYGAAEADSACIAGGAGAKPATANAACTDYSGCSYTWIKPTVVNTPTPIGSNPVGTLTCGSVHSVYSPYCKRSDGTVLASGDYKFCQASSGYNVNPSVPDTLGYDRTSTITTGCVTSDYEWRVGATAVAPGDATTGWGSWNDTCSNAATHTRAVTCYRKFDNSVAADSACATPAPVKSQTQPVYSSCSYQWLPTAWSASANTCATNTTQTRTVSCQRSSAAGHAWENDATVADCTAAVGAKPAVTQTLNDYSTCTYAWTPTAWSASSNTCSASATQTRTVTCLRSNGDTVADASCAGAKPAGSQTIADYSGCSYAWQTGGWSAWSSTCSAGATQTRSVYCQRSDGTTVGSGCAGAAPAASQTAANYSGCGYSFSVGGWSDWSSHCSASATQTRAVTCYRSDGTAMADASCNAAGVGTPARSQSGGVYDGCTYYGGPWWGNYRWSSTCSATAQRSDDRTCYRSDGTAMSTADPCLAAGVPVTETVTVANYSGCSYNWSVGGWSDWNSHCSPSATQTRAVTCYRSDGTAMSDASCPAAKPATTNGPTAVYDQCGGFWSIGGWSDWNSHCSGNAYQSRGVQCYQNGTGAAEADSFCNNTGAGATPARSNGPAAVYDGCGYAAVNYGGWSACTNGTQTNTAQCQRSDGAIVSSDNCTNRGVAVTQTQSCAPAWMCYYQEYSYYNGQVMAYYYTACRRSTDGKTAGWASSCTGGGCAPHTATVPNASITAQGGPTSCVAAGTATPNPNPIKQMYPSNPGVASGTGPYNAYSCQ